MDFSDLATNEYLAGPYSGPTLKFLVCFKNAFGLDDLFLICIMIYVDKFFHDVL